MMSSPQDKLPSQTVYGTRTNPNIYETARQAADYVAETIRELSPDFFDLPDPVDWERIFRYQQTIRLGKSMVAEALSVLKQEGYAPNVRAGETNELLNPVLFPFWQRYFSTDTLTWLLKANPVPLPFKARWCSQIQLLLRLRRSFKKSAKTVLCPADKPTVLVFLSAPVHYTLLRRILHRLEQRYDIYLVLTGALAGAKDRRALLDSFPEISQDRLLSLRSMEVSGNTRKLLFHHFNALNAQLFQLPESTRGFAGIQIRKLLDLAIQNAFVSSLLEQTRPVGIIGCMERSSLSPMLQEHRRRFGYKLINVQHGLMYQSKLADQYHFDAMLVWNDLSRQVLLQDGYPVSASLKVTGNPLWESDKLPTSSPVLDELRRWKNGRKLIAVYTQYTGDYTQPAERRKLLRTLLAHLEQNPEDCLLIKKHPLEHDTLVEDTLGAWLENGRIRVFSGGQVSLQESLALADLAVSISSTALLDALRYDVPSLAIDEVDATTHCGFFPLSPPFPVARSRDEALHLLNHLPDRNRPPDEGNLSFSPDVREQIFPALCIDDAIEAVLHELAFL